MATLGTSGLPVTRQRRRKEIMVLDFEGQRKQLLTLVTSVPIQGTLEQVNVAAKQMNGLVEALKSAEIAKVAKLKEVKKA